MENGCSLNSESFEYAVQLSNPLPVLEWLIKKYYLCSEYTFTKAIQKGNLDIIKWLYKKGCSNNFAFFYAISLGKIDVIEWLHNNGFSYDSMTFEQAMFIDNFEVIEWLYKNKCPWGNALMGALRNENIKNIMFLVEKKCPWGNFCKSDDAFMIFDDIKNFIIRKKKKSSR